MKIRKPLVLIAVAAIFILVGYWSKPDRGGVERCSESFGIPNLIELDLTHRRFLHWEPFESSKFRFEISANNFKRLSEVLIGTGYSQWERHGLEFGSLSLDANLITDFVSCSKRTEDANLYWGYSRAEGMLYAIERPH